MNGTFTLEWLQTLKTKDWKQLCTFVGGMPLPFEDGNVSLYKKNNYVIGNTTDSYSSLILP